MIKIELTNKEVTLLLSVLNDESESRQDMGCNDPYEREQQLFTRKEIIAMKKKIRGADFDNEHDNDKFMFNHEYVQVVISRIEEQVPAELIPG